ncbi:hypothetical protein B0I35DRAFT_420699 [Stachybotrys elegans]|uniref:Rhodopsin domain-containing protein n=1 Tax=Stachybotrys elegans TaxID=80388 RepID=A0A8K0T7V9_9HYPO|nr:hypothetical protein B0I35DRAFT_420699 [Stachybotrys elegans]
MPIESSHPSPGAVPEFPPGYTEEDRSYGLYIFSIAMTVITVLAILARFWSRTLTPTSPDCFGTTRFWWDDWTALASAPFIIAQHGLLFAMLNLGLGHHAAVLPIDDLFSIFKLFFAMYFLYDAAVFLTKMSALFFLTRIFPKHASPTWFHYSIWAAHFINIAWFVGATLASLLLCNPIDKNWDPTLPGTCGTRSAIWIGCAVTAVLIDSVILIIPIPKIWKLQISRARKLGISVTFILGYCAIVVSLGRTAFTFRDAEAVSTDITYELVPPLFWSSAEGTVLLLGICLPAMLPLGRHMFTYYFSPLACKVSQLLSTRGTERRESKNTHGETQGTPRTTYRLGNNKISSASEATELGTYHSMDSRREILDIPSIQTNYFEASISVDDIEADPRPPVSGIRVEHTFAVSQVPST